MRRKSNTDNNHRKKETVSDEEIKAAMTKMSVIPPESTKEQSLSKAFEGIEFAREKASKKRKSVQRRNWLKGMGATGLAAALMALILVNTEFIQDGFFSSGNAPEPEESESPFEDETETNEEDPMEEGTPDTFPEIERPDTKEIVTNPEGMGEVSKTYQLVYEEDFPFTTYIPDDFKYETFDDEYGKGISLSPEESEVMMMDILFFEEGISEEEARQTVNQELAHFEGVEELPRDEFEEIPEWAIASYYHSVENFGTMTLSSVNDHLFYVHDQYIGDAGDGWGPIKHVILEEWRWKETDEPLDTDQDTND